MQGLSPHTMRGRKRRTVVTAAVFSALEVLAVEGSVSMDAWLGCFRAEHPLLSFPCCTHPQ